MSPFRRWSNSRKAAVAVALALFLWIPQGISQTQQPVVTGHSTFWNGEGYDPCLASIAGIVKTQVMWFNDMVLAERYGGAGDYIYIAENGSDDPRPGRGHTFMWSDGTFYDFVDPNGAHWHVEESYYSTVGVSDDLTTVNLPSQNEEKTYVWSVQLSPTPIHDAFAGSPTSANYHDIYNFLSIVDTCKFRKTSSDLGDVVHEGEVLGPGHGHPAGATPHSHGMHMADIWIGTQPIIVPRQQNATNDASWSTQWSDPSNAQQAPNGYTGEEVVP